MIDDTSLDNFYQFQDCNLIEAIQIVKSWKAKGVPISGAKLEVAEDFIMKWADLFGYESI